MRTPRQPSQHSANGQNWSFMDARPAPQGMYDPRNEHDACGVGFVATLTGEASHALVEQALTVLRNLEHRGATGSEPDSGDGAGILLQVPDAFLREVAGLRAARGRRLRRRHRLPARGRTTAADAVSRIETIAAEEGLDRPRLARGPGRPRTPRRHRPLHDARLPPDLRRATAPSTPGHRPRPQGLRAAQARRARGRRLLPLALRADHRLQGHADHRPAGAVLPGPVRPPLRLRRRARPLALLHQHLPDAGRSPTRTASSRTTARSTPSRATATGWRPASPSSPPTCSATGRSSTGSSRSAPRTPPTPPPSTRCSNCSTSAAARCRTPC